MGKSQWVRMGVDYLAVFAFVAVIVATRNFLLATWVLVGASAVALLVGWIVERRLAPLPLYSGLMALVFGGLTLYFHDPKFVKMKMTFVDASLAVAMFAGLFMGKNPLKALMGEALVLPNQAWKTLTFRYGLFFAGCAITNEIVWRTLTHLYSPEISDARWGYWRLIAIGLAVVFAVTQTPFMMKNMEQPDAPTPEPPDAGF
jgi:intracellular septation protein